jgi:hypothetical protein
MAASALALGRRIGPISGCLSSMRSGFDLALAATVAYSNDSWMIEQTRQRMGWAGRWADRLALVVGVALRAAVVSGGLAAQGTPALTTPATTDSVRRDSADLNGQLGRVIAETGTIHSHFRFATGATIGPLTMSVDWVRFYGCDFAMRRTLVSESASHVETSVSLILLDAAAISIGKYPQDQSGTFVFDPTWWATTVLSRGGTAVVSVKDVEKGRIDKVPSLVINADSRDDASKTAGVLRAAILRCQATATPR